MTRKTTQKLQETLQDVFGLESFRAGQEEVITSVLSGQDTLVYMPTGGGKSLTYQLPGMMREGLTIVVSPLISLMKDQVDALQKRRIAAELINSTQTANEQEQVFAGLASIDFLYIAPERLNSPRFMTAIGKIKIALLAIDEAHCISQWGHDFRPSYMKIKSFIEDLGGEDRSFPVIGLTATATPKVREDIIDRLGLGEHQSFISGFDRKNIILVVRELAEKEAKQEKTKEIIEKTPGCGIVYCSSRKHVIELSQYLLNQGIKTGIYKGDLTPEKREEEQNKFMNDEYKVMVATNAFGMGIDKKDIRFVIHYNLPGSIENYYQEVGRAGRDGKMSYAVVLASYGDTKIQEFFIENTYPSKQQVLDFYEYLYKDIPFGQGKDIQISKTYFTLASESQVGSDMLIGSIIKILEKYNIIQRGLSHRDEEEEFRGRGLTVLQEKRKSAHILIDWTRQDLLREEAYNKLEQIKKLLFYPSCRKRFILGYFGDTEDLEKLPQNCKLCDYCLEGKNISEDDAKKFLSVASYSLILETVKKYNEKFGIVLLSCILAGGGDKRISEWNLDTYEHFGALSDIGKDTISAMFEALMMNQFLAKTSGKYPCVGITDFGGGALYRNTYIVSELVELNTFVMNKVQSSKKIPSSKTGEKVKKQTAKGETLNTSLALFQKNKSLSEIAEERELKISTIQDHIASLYNLGKISLSELLDLFDVKRGKKIKEYVATDEYLTEPGLRKIKDHISELGEESDYMEIKLVLAMIEKGDL